MRDYPPARVPAHPVLSWGTFGRRGRVAGVLDAPHRLDVMSGRMALAHALRHLGIGAGAEVLLPAWHCTALVEPVVHAGATPVFFRVHEDGAPDLDDVAGKAGPATRAVVAIHYFGIPQDLRPLRALADERGLALVEDCAHAFFGVAPGGRPVGALGDCAIASWWKFFPVREGGLLASHAHAVDRIALRAPGRAYEARSAVNALEEAGRFGRLRPLPWLLAPLWALKDALLRLRRRRASAPAPAGPEPASGTPVPARDEGPPTHVPTGSADFEPYWLDRRPARFTRWVGRRASRRRIVARRRAHYARYAEALGDVPGCRPLYPELPQGAVPYVFPLRFDEPESAFDALKRRGVPLVRFGEFLWEGVDASVCPVAAAYARRLFQLPCHQELRDAEREWIIAEVRRVAVPVRPLCS